MVDYYKLPTPRNLPDPEQEEEQDIPQPELNIIWNVYTEKGDAKSMALKVSIRLPLKV